MKLKPNSTPARQRLRKERKENRCIVPVTQWVNSYVLAAKDVCVDSSNSHTHNYSIKKKLRSCPDPSDLNESLEREPYWRRTVDELRAKFFGAIIFIIV